MTEEIVKTRFAPSPSGRLHVGNVRTALFNWLMAHQARGIFLLRIEDTDISRSSEEAVSALIEDLQWLGLSWDEGPGVGGNFGPYRQSERGEIYQGYYEILQKQGLAYRCFCSPQELSIARKTQLARGEPPRYPGTCRNLSRAEVQAKLSRGLKPTLRFRVAAGDLIEFTDQVRGPQRFATEDIGDFVIRRADGTAAFFFTNALDDALMGVTDVLRGEDHLSNTPRQMLILKALGLRIPHYGHLSMILGEDGAPLAKRLSSLSVRQLRESGYLPIAVNNTLARLGHYYQESRFVSMDALAAGFSTTHLGRAPARFDIGQLDRWQKEAVVQVASEDLWSWMGPAVHRWVPEADKPAFIEAIRPNIILPGEALDWAKVIYSESAEISETAKEVLGGADPNLLREALETLDACPNDFNGFIERLKARVNQRGKQLFQPLRAAMTGRIDGPELGSLFSLIGPDRLRRRLKTAMGGLPPPG